MKFISDDRAARLMTPKKNRCVWMEAGILSYLLCDREFDCDHCPLDEAMRSHFSSAAKKAVAAEHEEPPAGAGHPTSRAYFTPDHLQVTILDDGGCRLSVEPGLAGILPPVKSVVLPHNGQRLTPDAFSCWLILEGGTLPLKMPVGGTVTEVNRTLAEHPHRVNGTDGGDGWLFDFTPDDRNAFRRAFLKPAEVGPRYLADRDLFRRLAMECLHPAGGGVGRTLQDGGRLVDDLSSMIGPVKYLEIVRRSIRGNH